MTAEERAEKIIDAWNSYQWSVEKTVPECQTTLRYLIAEQIRWAIVDARSEGHTRGIDEERSRITNPFGE